MMQILEKILKEIEEAMFQEDAPIYAGDMEVDRYVRESAVKDINRSHMDDGKDIPHTCDTCRRYEKSDHNCYYCRHKERPDLWETKEKAHE